MIRTIDLDELKGDMLPQAVVNLPVSYFAERFGGHLEKGHDELDYFEGTGFVLDGILPFAMKHYRGHPGGTSTIYLPFSIQRVEMISDIVGRIASAMGFPTGAIIWQRADDPDL
jgi:hypothetical protein